MVDRHKILILAGVVLMYGCGANALHREYEFISVEKDLRWGVLHAKLRGATMTKSDNLTITGSPYELLIWFTVHEKESIQGCEIIINDLKLIPLSSPKTINVVNIATAQFKQKKEGMSVANFLFKNIELKFVNYRLLMNYHLTGLCTLPSEERTVELIFKRDYQERKISFWDSLMGI